MKICIYGAGAIGGYLGAKLALAGEQVTLIARGAHLQAMQQHGLRLMAEDQTHVVHPACTEDPAEAGRQDYVIVTLKTHSAAAVADRFGPLLGPNTAVVTAMNGIPWWYFYKLTGPWENHRLPSVDPDGRQWEMIGPERAIGCVVYASCEIVRPGVVKHVYGHRFELGEPDGVKTDRCRQLTQTMVKAGVKARLRSRIRDDVWLKLWGNLCFNPISALTHAGLATVAIDPGTRWVARNMMREAEAVATRLGNKFIVDIDTRMQWSADVGDFKTSMLQDLESGRPLEIDALVTAVQEMARLVGVETPYIDTVHALVQQRAAVAGRAV